MSNPPGSTSISTRSASRLSLNDPKRIIDTLLRNLVQKKTITPEDMDSILGITMRKVADVVFAQAVSVFTVEKATQRIRFRNVYYSPSLYGLDGNKKKLFEQKAKELQSVTLGLDQGIVGKVIRTGEAVFLEDVRRDENFSGSIDESTGFQTQSMIAVPLKNGLVTFGCIQVLNKSRDSKNVLPFDESDVSLVQEVAEYSGRIIQRALDPNTPFDDREMAGWVAKLSNTDLIEIDPEFQPDFFLLEAIGEEKLKRYQILPLKKLDDRSLSAAVANPLDFQSLQDFELVSGFKLTEKKVASSGEIKAALLKVFPEHGDVGEVAKAVHEEFDLGEESAGEVTVGEGDDENSAPIVKLANRIIEDAYRQGSSDIHIEPSENKVQVRYRVDGICKETLALPKKAHRPLISRIKIMSEMDIAERRLPQDGRIIFKKYNPKLDVDLRVSTAPMNHGEKVCMRILDKTKSTLPLDALGFSQYNMDHYRKLIQAPYGMILHCGPTGSGKSMTLYAALNEINSPEWNISTAEDPIEYTLPGLNQMQMKKEIGLTFANALRCFLRQDPDIILVGEIRDQETAEIAIEAALTGHLLFSTLHTNDAPSTVTRLVEMGIEPFMISTSLVCVCAQRLMRRLCKDCKVFEDPKPDELDLMRRAKDGSPVGKIGRPGGCPKCSNGGYKGRVGIHELLTMNDELREIVNKHGNAEDIKKAARNGGMQTLFEDAMEKVKAGVSSLPEAIGTAKPDETYDLAPVEGTPEWHQAHPGGLAAAKSAPKAKPTAPVAKASASQVAKATEEPKKSNTLVGLGWLGDVDEKKE